MYREPSNNNNNNSSNETMNSSASAPGASDQNRSIQQTDALSLFMKDLRITPSSFTIVMDNPRSRSSPQNMVFQKSRSEGKGSSRWQATTEDNIMSGLKTISSSSVGGLSSSSSSKKGASGKKKLRRKLKKEFADKHQDQNDNSRSTPKRSSSFDAVSVSSRTRREQQQQQQQQQKEPRRKQRLNRSYSDHLGPASSSTCGNHSAPTLPQRRYSRDIDKALMVDQAPRMAVRKTSCTYEVSTANAKIPTRRRRHASKSPTRKNSDPTTAAASSLSPTRSNFRVMVS